APLLDRSLCGTGRHDCDLGPLHRRKQGDGTADDLDRRPHNAPAAPPSADLALPGAGRAAMIGRTLGFYFFRRFAAITMWNFLGVAALVYIVTFTEIAGRAGGLEGYSAGWALSLAAFQLPFIMQQAVPFIGLIAAIAALLSLNRKYELVIARAAGISAWQFLTPIAAGAFVFGLLSILILNPI